MNQNQEHSHGAGRNDVVYIFETEILFQFCNLQLVQLWPNCLHNLSLEYFDYLIFLFRKKKIIITTTMMMLLVPNP